MSDFFAEQPSGAPGSGGPGGSGGPPAPASRGPRRPRPLLLTVAVIGVLVIGFSLFAGLWTDKLWFGSLGYGSVFSKLLWTRILLFVVFGGAMALIVGINLYLAFRLRPMFRPHSPEQANLERYREVVTPLRRILLIGVSVVFGIFAGVSATGKWRNFLLWNNREDFGKADPYFHKDIGFYVFSLPWLHFLVDFAMTALFTALAARGRRALPVRRHPAAVGLRPGLRRRPGPALRAVRAVPAAQGRRLLARPVRPDLAVRQPDHRHDLHPRPRGAAGEEHPDVHRGDLRGAVLRQHRPPHLAAARRGPGAVRDLRRAAGRRLAGPDAAVPGQARRAGQGSVVHRQEHPGDARCVRPGGHQRQRLRRQHHALAAPARTPTPPRCPASGWSTRSWSPRPSSSCSRCAATTACRRCSTSTATRSTARSATSWSRPARCTSRACPTPRRSGPTRRPSTPTATA